MSQHLVVLYDEIHRVFYLKDNLANDPDYGEVRIGQDGSGHFLLLVGTDGVKKTIRLKSIKIPPSTGPDFTDLFGGLSEKLSTEFNSLM